MTQIDKVIDDTTKYIENAQKLIDLQGKLLEAKDQQIIHLMDQNRLLREIVGLYEKKVSHD